MLLRVRRCRGLFEIGSLRLALKVLHNIKEPIIDVRLVDKSNLYLV